MLEHRDRLLRRCISSLASLPPKALALKRSEATALWVVRPLRLFMLQPHSLRACDCRVVRFVVGGTVAAPCWWCRPYKSPWPLIHHSHPCATMRSTPRATSCATPSATPTSAAYRPDDRRDSSRTQRARRHAYRRRIDTTNCSASVSGSSTRMYHTRRVFADKGSFCDVSTALPKCRCAGTYGHCLSTDRSYV